MSLAIRTPDQRLRVFVSSTKDAGDERQAAFAAVEALQMVPVGAELAGPAGRSIAESYLAQCHLFIGLYGSDPGAEFDGMTDVEHQLRQAKDLPKLMYLREGADDEPGVQPLLDAMAADPDARMRRFRDIDDLQEAIATDVAVVLTERFEETKRAPRVDPTAVELPAHPTRFVGREHEVAELQRLLDDDDVRLVTLTGPGGIGKSRLAFEVARQVAPRFKDGIRYALLSPLTDPQLVLPTIAKALGVTESADRTMLDNLKEYLKDKEMLLLLDNFEHVVAAAPQLAELLQSASRIRIVVTSRALLFVRGEHELPVPPLPLPEHGSHEDGDVLRSPAVELFIERAASTNPAFDVSPRNLRVIAQICSMLDGLPLAIELAAARTRLLTPEAMLPRLTNRLKLLTGGPIDLPERQQTLRATLDWDYDLLAYEEQVVFRRLSVFVPSALLAAAEEVLPGEGEAIDVLDGIESLVNKSLLHQRDTIDGEPRFVMINTLREYAREKLDEDPVERDDVRARHAIFYESYAQEAARHVNGPEAARWIEALDMEHDNLRSALAVVAAAEDDEIHLRFAASLAPFWEYRAHLSEGQRALEEALARRPDGPATLRARCLEWAAVLARGQGEYKRSVAFAEQAASLYRELNDPKGLGTALKHLGGIAYERADYSTARKYFEESLRIRQREHDPRGIAELQNNLGVLARLDGDLDAAAANYELALAHFRREGDKRAEGRVLMNLGEVKLDQGTPDEAETLLCESLRLFREISSHWDIADEIELMAGVWLEQGRYADATRLYGAASALRDVLGAPLPAAEEHIVTTRVARLRERLGEDEFAAAWADGRGWDAPEAVEKILDGRV